MQHEVKVGEVFEGPIELLLSLITRQRVDIYEVSLATITEEYLAALGAMENLDLESATGFLVVAATLLELKSARLLPGRQTDEIDAGLLEERDRLLAKLVEVSTFRNAGEWVGISLGEGAGFHPRVGTLEEPYASMAPDPLAHVSLERLARAAAAAFAPSPEPVLDTSHVSPITETVRDAIADVAARLQVARVMTLEQLCSDVVTRIGVVVRFLALLELFKAGAVDLFQGDRFGDIRASWDDSAEVEELLSGVDEYGAGIGGDR